MTKIMNVVAIGTAMALAAITQCAFAQDDLDDLLKDLDNESKAKPAAKQEAPAQAVPATEKAAPKVEAPAPAVKPAAEQAAKKEEAVKPVADASSEPAKEEKPVAKAAVPEKPVVEVQVKAAEKPVAEPAADKAKVEAAANVVKELAAEAPAKAEEKKPGVVKPADPDAELIANLSATEKLRRQALDAEANREVEEARDCMENSEYTEAVRHFGLAAKLLNDRPGSRILRKECEEGIAEGLYRAALQEDELGRRERAVKLMEKAVDMRHPKARRTLEKWNKDDGVLAKDVDASEYTHRRNDEDFKKERGNIRKHLRRSRQYLSVRDMEKALEECEIVLVNDPYNQEAIRLRNQIQRKRQTILQQERVASRDGMIADVDQAWRPVYAVNAAKLNDSVTETLKKPVGDDPERTIEQDIEKRMKEMRLPQISFKPPATIMDAVEFFSQASKDYDRPDIPLEKRGFNFALRTPQPLKAAGGEDQGNNGGFGEDEPANPANGLAPIPKITASDITFWEALKLVCDSVDYKFIVRGPVVMVMHKDMSTAELLSRKYDVLAQLIERINGAAEDMKDSNSSGFSSNKKKDDEGEDNLDRKLRMFFEQMGVKFPEGSSITYIQTLGKLYVRNTRENLAELEKVLQEMGAQTKLIEIETRFVEVSQEDLNSLGFEWILNSDYSLNVGNSLGRALGIKNGVFGSETGSKNWNTSSDASGMQTSTLDSLSVNGKNVDGYPTQTVEGQQIAGNSSSFSQSYTRSEPYSSAGADWISGNGDRRNIGVNAFGGTDSKYGNGNRYLSTTGNHISGESNSNNDQFMRVNAFLGTADLSMILHMLSQRSDTDLLSAPKVVTRSGENAVIKVVKEYIYPQDYDVQLQSSSSSGSSTTGGGSSSAILAVVEPQNFTMREVGVILDVTPTYTEANGGTIDLELKPSVVEEPTWKNYGMKIPFTGNPSQSTPSLGWVTSLGTDAINTMSAAVQSLIMANSETIAQKYVDAGIESMNPNTITYYDAPMEQPFFSVRSIDSKVSITPGSTVVMGGLITEQRKAMDDKIPFLGDLPFIGRLFRSHAEQTIKRNLLIFVTGRLITPSGRELRLNEETSDEAEVKAAPKVQ